MVILVLLLPFMNSLFIKRFKIRSMHSYINPCFQEESLQIASKLYNIA